MKPEDVLKQFGLTDTEIKAYLALLGFGEATVLEIAKKANAYKANVYELLNSLEKRGLATHIKKNNKTFYSAINPEKLFEILENRKEDLISVFSLLKELYKSKKTEREINVISGLDGLKTLFNDMHNVNKDILSIGSSLQVISVMEHRLIHFLKKIEKKKIAIRMIVVDRESTRKQANDFQKLWPFISVRFYHEKHLSPVAFTTYSDRLALQIWENEPLILLIKDRHIAKTFKNYFDLIWAVSKK